MQWLCWLLGTSVRKIDDVALDLLVFLGAVVFTDEMYWIHYILIASGMIVIGNSDVRR
jgi:hypothetical protein